MHVNAADNVLHLVVGLVAAGTGFFAIFLDNQFLLSKKCHFLYSCYVSPLLEQVYGFLYLSL
jgi:hypothetical protein